MRKLLIALLATVSVVAQTPQRGVFLEDIDRTKDACTNFFDYANGAWRAANPIPPSMQRWSRRWQAGELNKDALRGILDEVSQKHDWQKGSVEQQISDFYGSCLDEKRVNQLGSKPIQPLLAEIDRVQSRAALQDIITRLQDLEIFVPFGVGSAPDRHNPTQTILNVGAGGLGLPDRDYYFKSDKRFVEAREKYRAHVAKMFELLGSSKATAKKQSDAVFNFETRLAQWHLDNVARRNPNNTDHLYMLTTLQAMTPHFSWKRYLDRTNMAEGQVNVTQPLYMEEVERELATAPLSDWRAYLRWQVVHAAADALSDPFVKENFAFYEQYLAGSKEMKPRWKRCIEQEDQLLGEALGQKYVERYFPPAAKARMQEMVRNLLSAMGDTIQRLEWMSPETKQQALHKLSTFNPKVGYPDKWKDYSSVSIAPDSYFQNIVNALKYDVSDDRSRVGKPTDRGQWGMTPPTSNAYYNPSLNEIVFPAGILQPPAFDMNAADAVNYGAIGVVIGHEISHGFDDQGAKFDAEGRLKNWWTADDKKHFDERTACVADQFENYFIEPGIHHQGRLVLGESIGDLAGAKIAYLAFQKAQQQHPAQTIDGFTPDQQFFIGWGQFRGDEIRTEAKRLMVQGDPHPTGEYRVIGPLSNLPEFATAFGCKADSAMVRPPAKRCEVW
jgi:endothelin-converting enzyme/putative endopeptidase